MTTALAQIVLPDDVNQLIKGLQTLNKLSLYSEILLVHYDADLQVLLLLAYILTKKNYNLVYT